MRNKPYLAGQRSRHLVRILARRNSPYRPYQYLASYLSQCAQSCEIRFLAIQLLDKSSKSLLALQCCSKHPDCDLRYVTLEALNRSWKNHFISLKILLDLAQDPHRDVQHLAVTFLVENWSHHPEALNCLKKLLNSNASFAVKLIAIEALQDW